MNRLFVVLFLLLVLHPVLASGFEQEIELLILLEGKQILIERALGESLGRVSSETNQFSDTLIALQGELYFTVLLKDLIQRGFFNQSEISSILEREREKFPLLRDLSQELQGLQEILEKK